MPTIDMIAVKERPIPFSPSSVRAILDGRKTQTRRVIKPQPHPNSSAYGDVEESAKHAGEWFQWHCAEPGPSFTCRYGVKGERLWVKEPWGIGDHGRLIDPCLNYRTGDQRPLIGHADGVWSMAGSRHVVNDADLVKVKEGWRNGMFTPRWASRLLLEIAEVRAERVQEIDEAGARAEGLACVTKDGTLYKYGVPDIDRLPGTDDHGWPWSMWNTDPRRSYRRLWDSINAKRGFSWQSNPWVWVIAFSEVKLNG